MMNYEEHEKRGRTEEDDTHIRKASNTHDDSVGDRVNDDGPREYALFDRWLVHELWRCFLKTETQCGRTTGKLYKQSRQVKPSDVFETTHEIDPKDCERAEREHTGIVVVDENQTQDKQDYFGNVCRQKM